MVSLKVFLLTLLFYIVLDAAWLFGLGKHIYENQIGHMMREMEVSTYICALFVYILLTLGLVLFVLPHSMSYASAAFYGLVYGFIIYGIYDFTNYALLSGWTPAVLVTDLLWGIILNTLASLLAFYLAKG